MENNEKKIFDEEWQKLREEYQQIFENNKEEDFVVKKENVEDIPDIILDFQDIKEEENEEVINEIEKLKTDKDRFVSTKQEIENNNKKKAKQIFTIASDGMEQLLQRMKKRKNNNFVFLEENRRELANVLVVISFITLLIIFCLFISQVPKIISNVFNLGKKHDTIIEENIVYVDENNYIYHYENCSHIKEGMRYLKLEEIYALQLGFKKCNK